MTFALRVMAMGKNTTWDFSRGLFLASCLLALGCSGGGGDGQDPGGSTGDGDGDGDSSEPQVCEDNDDCSDDVFCNGEERCNPDHDDADAFGCLPAADEPCSDGDGCDESSESCGCEEPDADGDGHDSEACGGDDCDDDDPNRYEGNAEVCDANHHDEDCNPETFGFRDQDGDDDPDAECCNEDESGDLICGTDCNDNRGNQHSFNTEVCDDIDNDCDGLVDEAIDGDEDDGLKKVFTVDLDEDGWGSNADDADTVFACEAPEGYVESATDCDDDDNQVSPSATEVCDYIDNDCDGLEDEQGDEENGLKVLYTEDADNDLFGSDADDAETVLACSKPDNYAEATGDCDEGNPDINPGEIDSCTDDIDNNCSGVVNDPIGGCDCEGNETQSCALSGSVGKCATFTQQCNDGVWDDCPLELNSEPEVCDAVGVDENCDGYVNNLLGSTVTDSLKVPYYRDRDGDGYPDLSTSQAFCADLEPAGWVTNENEEDCVDQPLATNPLSDDIHPGATEVCNGRDDNCDNIVDGLTSNGDLETTFYYDGDNDGQAGSGTTMSACVDPGARWHPTAQDCNDSNANIYFGAQEICNGADQDCDGVADVDDPDASENCDVTGQIASAVCAMNACMVDECSGAYLDCDAAYDCETNGATDIDHCGECGNSCYFTCSDGDCEEIVEVAVGDYHSCALVETGEVSCWGSGLNGRLGNNGTTLQDAPVLTGVLGNVVQLSGGTAHTCAVQGTEPGVAYCWGSDGFGQLGNTGTETGDVLLPAPVHTDSNFLDDAIAVSVGSTHTCVIEASHPYAQNGLLCWGDRTNGRTGVGSSSGTNETPYYALAEPSGTYPLGNVTAVATGDMHTCAIVDGFADGRSTGRVDDTDYDRAVFCAGDDSFGQNGNSAAQPNPAQDEFYPVTGLSGVSAIAAGFAHTCALLQGGTVQCWGRNQSGESGQAGTSPQHTPATVSGVSGAKQVAVGTDVSCVIFGDDDEVQCWGNNDRGQLGTSGGGTSSSPLTISGLSGVTEIAVGAKHVCAQVGARGAIYCWGDNQTGQLGRDGLDTQPQPDPEPVAPLASN